MTQGEVGEQSTADLASNRYQDYVIRDGQFIGEFEAMYRNADEIPWHQDQTVHAIFSDLTVAILRHREVTSLLDVGCGLGYMAARLKREIPGLRRVVGIDISPTAIDKAREMFPEIAFHAGTPASVQPAIDAASFDVVVSKDVLWYILDDLAGYLATLAALSRRYVYIGQSFPDKKPFFGQEVLPDAGALLGFIRDSGHRIVYSAVEVDADYGGREYVHALIEVDRT